MPQQRAAAMAALVAAAQRGDRDSFGQIFDEYQLPVYRYALARLRSPADAEDATAETFVAALRNIRRFRWRGVPFDAWLFRIARSKVADVQRRRQRHGATTDIGDVNPARLPIESDVASVAIARDTQARMLEHLRTLTPMHQDVLALRFLAGLSLEETAEALGKSTNAVKQLQFRAVGALRDRMQADR
ncbi:MAG: RNA polymerase sigma factor [Chloroflexota bacterium]|nr:RNA polymerase sigma factor [Chloroflexota bacterium]